MNISRHLPKVLYAIGLIAGVIGAFIAMKSNTEAQEAAPTVLTYHMKTPLEIAAETLGVPMENLVYEHFEDGTIRFTVYDYYVPLQKIQSLDVVMASDNMSKKEVIK